MVKKSILFLFFIINICFSMFVAATEIPATQQNSLVLPPIRRIGLNIVDVNVDEFRNFMRKQDRLLYGVPALPYNEQDIKKKTSSRFRTPNKKYRSVLGFIFVSIFKYYPYK